MEIDYPASKPKGLVDKLTQIQREQKGDKEIQLPQVLKDGNDYTLSNNFLREELPVVLGLTAGYAGGDLVIYDAQPGHNGWFVDVYSDRETQYQIHVEFAEIGLKKWMAKFGNPII